MTLSDPILQDARQPAARAPYRAAIDRPRLTLPEGAQLAIWPVVNVEFWDAARAMPRQVLSAPTGVSVIPDVPNWAWHEYGMRVGFWRFLEMFRRRGIRPTLSINGHVCTAYPRLAAAARDAGWEFMGHGHVQRPAHQLADEAAEIALALDTIARFTGTRPVGWLGPGLTETLDTPDLLTAAGIAYVGDWPLDDRPSVLTTANGPLVTLPYSVELNDVPVIALQHHSAETLAARAMAQAERLLAEASDPGPTGGARIMGIALHPYLSGVPHRIGAIERLFDDLAALPGVVFRDGAGLLDWYRAAEPEAFA